MLLAKATDCMGTADGICDQLCVGCATTHFIDHFRITVIWPGDRIRRPEHPTENEVRRCSCDESV